jgi:hypothetical protein
MQCQLRVLFASTDPPSLPFTPTFAVKVASLRLSAVMFGVKIDIKQQSNIFML